MVNQAGKIRNSELYSVIGLFFILTFGFFFFLGHYILYFQETQSLFVFSGEYLQRHLQKPGALLEYAARFLSQFYPDRLTGSLIISVILTLPAIILHIINRRLILDVTFSLLLLMIPSCLLLVAQANYYHLMEYNLGFLIVIIYYLLFISSSKIFNRILILLLFPLVYYLSGAYIIVFMAMYIVHHLFAEKGRNAYLYSFLIIIEAAITFLIFWKVIFYQPVQQFLLSPLPFLEKTSYIVTLAILAGCLAFYPMIQTNTVRLTLNKINKKIYAFASLISVFVLVGFLVLRTYNPQTKRVVELERLVFEEKWDEAIKYQETTPARNLIGEYFYNIALSETGQLCDRLFHGPQDFLAGSLVLPWSDIHLNRGAYFYYAIGLVNEAHRWAYEEMVVYGYRPQNIELLVKTSLINGDFGTARKYLNIMKRTFSYRKWALEFEKMVDNPDLIRLHPELGAKLKLVPKNNFFIQFNEPQNNLPLILEGQPGNTRAIEYYLAGLLLTKKVEIAVSNIINMKESGYTRIPRHLEEAVMIYYNSTGKYPDLGGLEISNDTRARFNQYFTAYVNARNLPSKLDERMKQNFGDTFWYYFHFK